MPKWTDQQRDAIADRGHSLIVCAAAGSGKTAVLVERIVQLVREGCPIENMLVVTFTNAAAGEMRQRKRGKHFFHGITSKRCWAAAY